MIISIQLFFIKIKKNIPYLVILAFAFLLSCCNTTKYLDPGKSYLSKNSIEIKGKVTDKLAFKSEIETLFKQTPTSKRKRWFYYKTSGRLQRRFGEKPSIHDPIIANKTAQSIQFFLQNKGYYKAKVRFSDKSKRSNFAHIVYSLELNELYTIDSVQFLSEDIEIKKIMNEVGNETFLKRGAPVDVSLYRQEVARLTNVIRNFGYANFYSNYFAPLEGDTSNFKTNIKMTALKFNETSVHQKYTIGKILVLANYKPDAEIQQKLDTVVLDEVHYVAPNGVFPIKMNLLQNCIKVIPQNIFRQENLDYTYQKFENLNAFRLINIKTEFSNIKKQEVNIIITLVPYGKRSLTSNFELNSTQGGTQSLGNNVGLTASVSLRNNNVFGGAEKSNTNVEFSVQGLLGNNQNIFYETSLLQDFSVPKFYDPLHFWKGLNKVVLLKKGTALSPRNIKLLSDADYLNLQDKASSKFTGGFKFIQSIPIDYLQINANFGYGVLLGKNKSLNINQLSLEFLNPIKLAPPISDNDFLKRLFGRQLVTSVFFKDLSLISKYLPKNSSGWTRKFRFNLEQSGLEIFAINKVLDASNKRIKVIQFGDLDYSRFVRSEIDWAAGRKFGLDQSIHFHVNMGAALPYGYKNTIVPYVKQYFVGGPTSMRGWQPRELGPGGWDSSSTNAVSYYATGDFKAEANAEVRFGIWWIFKSAFFLDVGNVWSFYRNSDYPEGNLTSDFYKQLAVTAGTGLRIDFDYSVIRIDLGYRLRYPYQDSKLNYWNFGSSEFKKWNLTFGLGYPF